MYRTMKAARLICREIKGHSPARPTHDLCGFVLTGRTSPCEGEPPLRQVAKDFGASGGCLRSRFGAADIEDGVPPGTTAAQSSFASYTNSSSSCSKGPKSCAWPRRPSPANSPWNDLPAGPRSCRRRYRRGRDLPGAGLSPRKTSTCRATTWYPLRVDARVTTRLAVHTIATPRSDTGTSRTNWMTARSMPGRIERTDCVHSGASGRLRPQARPRAGLRARRSTMNSSGVNSPHRHRTRCAERYNRAPHSLDSSRRGQALSMRMRDQ